MILVTGCARSGTSLTTRILKAHGCHLGEPLNRLHENTAVREGVVKKHLRRLGVDPLGQASLPETNTVRAWPGMREEVLRMIGGREPRAYKGAKISLLWPAWLQAFPEAKWVLVRRDPERIVDSCIRTNFMRAHGDNRDAWRDWVREHEMRFEAMRARLDLVEVWPDQVIADPEAFRPVARHCGLTFDRDAVAKEIDERVWHASQS